MKKNTKNKKVIFRLILMVGLLLLSFAAFSRAGGAGGSRSSGGGGGGGSGGGGFIFDLIYIVLFNIPFPFNLMIIGIVIYIIFKLYSANDQRSVLNDLPTGETIKSPSGLSDYRNKNANFNQEAFIEKVKIAFTQIQKSWENKDLGPVRKYISDGVYQRFNIQFKMMELLKQKNTINSLAIKNVYIDKIESDGLFDIIHVAIQATIDDNFISESYPELNNGGREEFVEYWSFIKKRGIEEKNLFNSPNCPKCGAPLPKDSTDLSKCTYCNTITNSGEYDWILSEITQAEDYVSLNPQLNKDASLYKKVRGMLGNVTDFSVQTVEDKVSNGYLQIETAKVLKDNSIMRRFVTDEYFQKASSIILAADDFVYNRIYLNDVTLVAAKQENEKNILIFAVKLSYQPVRISKTTKKLAVDYLSTKTEMVFMSKDIKSSENKGSLYAKCCPSCGGPIVDTLKTKCSYCNSELNSTKTEWIISDVMTKAEYVIYYKENSDSFQTDIAPSKIDGLFSVRDFALNNAMLMMAADGIFSDEEKEFASKIAKKWGYNLDKIQPMFDLAIAGKLSVRMPDSPEQRKKMYLMLEDVAKADGNISAEEQAFLDKIKKDYSINV
jgi:predicted lipid-binding transport protein (Tim44 family)